jgi:hypothetical protein
MQDLYIKVCAAYNIQRVYLSLSPDKLSRFHRLRHFVAIAVANVLMKLV